MSPSPGSPARAGDPLGATVLTGPVCTQAAPVVGHRPAVAAPGTSGQGNGGQPPGDGEAGAPDGEAGAPDRDAPSPADSGVTQRTLSSAM